MNNHTKRSAEFLKEITNAAARIDELADMFISNHPSNAQGSLRRVAEILRNNTTDSGCIVKAAEDEPIFVLRAKDITSGGGPELGGENGVVDHWCELQIGHRMIPGRINGSMERIAEARDCAREMRDYPNRKWPD
jgi:hypothetical protein